jgi:hypothetical protein
MVLLKQVTRPLVSQMMELARERPRLGAACVMLGKTHFQVSSAVDFFLWRRRQQEELRQAHADAEQKAHTQKVQEEVRASIETSPAASTTAAAADSEAETIRPAAPPSQQSVATPTSAPPAAKLRPHVVNGVVLGEKVGTKKSKVPAAAGAWATA